MKLRYLKGNAIRVNWTGTSEFTDFSPVGETTDERGQRLLDNPQYAGHFEKVGNVTPMLKCEFCGKEIRTKAALASHKRKHKEISQ
jgi:hypothetical protein